MEKHRSVFDVLSDDIFTDREELIAVLKEIALGAKVQRYISPVLIGHRRVGKTEVLKRLYNELFWEQDEVVPIYITFEELSRESRRFATKYFGTFLSQYVGFKEKDVELARSAEFDEIIERAQRYAKENNNYGLSHILKEYHGAAKTKEFTWPVLDYAIWAPRRVSRDNEEPMFVMLDEFQHVIEIRDENGIDPNVLGKYQHAVEYRRCPHLVTGSAVTLLTKDIIGRGSLFGRFRAEYIRGLEGYYVIELCQKLGKHQDVKVNVEMASYLSDRTGGNPFYLECIFAGARRLRMDLINLDAVNEVISYELTQGAIWSELYRQLNYYFNTINEYGITKNIFYFATRYQDERINKKRIAESMKHWGVTEEQVVDILLALSRADLIEEKVAGTEFYNIKDPIMREFTDAWARVDVENATWEEANVELQERYNKLAGVYANLKGYATELMVQFLMMRFNRHEVEGKAFFNHTGRIFLPRFVWVDSRTVKLPDSPQYQIDVVGRGVPHLWLVEVKNTEQPIGLQDVKHFAEACGVAAEVIGGEKVTRWYVSTNGFTQDATDYLNKHEFLYSDRNQINQLLRHFGLRELPV
jgi:hypothetical protein